MQLNEVDAGVRTDVPVTVRVLDTGGVDVVVLLEDGDDAVARLMSGDTPVIHVHDPEIQTLTTATTTGGSHEAE